ncbi:MAG: DEAD/DEAH box helicase [Actinomycetota bacterium]
MRGSRSDPVKSAPVATAAEAVFVPDPLPRGSCLALWRPDAVPTPPDGLPSHTGEIELVLPSSRSVRRRRVRARLVRIGDVLAWLTGLGPGDEPSVSLAAWVVATRLGVDAVARGRLFPAVTEDGYDTWRVGPLDPVDEARLGALTERFPPTAHSLAVPGTGPARISDPAVLVRACWDAIADALVRTSAATATVGSPPWAARQPTRVAELAGWLEQCTTSDGDGARPGLRLELGDDAATARAVLQLRSRVDPSLVIDAAELWNAPAAVLQRLGDEAETELLLALRRAARAWPPAGRLLDDARPSLLDLDEDDTAELLGPASEALAAAGFEVLWPAQLTHPSLELRAVVQTPAPAAVTEAGLSLDRLCECSWEAFLDGQALTAAELDELAEAKRPLVRLRGRWVVADPTLLERLRRGAGRVRAADALAGALAGTLRVDGTEVAVSVDGALAGLADRLRHLDGARELPEPASLEATLRPYQRRGLAWLVEMCELGLGGCLADDMGLGKTIQLIALHLHRHAADPAAGPTLVVCPTSLLGNWEREVARFAPSVPVRRFHGGGRHLDDMSADEVVLASYGVVRRDRAELAAVGWGVVVADEAQHVKNPLSRAARELRAIPTPARLALTGTPVENRLTDLWALLDWTTPGLLGPLATFRRNVAIPVERDRDPAATEHLARLVRPFLLRRRKDDPAITPELPPKTETDVVVSLTPEQVTLYEAVVRETLAKIAEAEGIERRGLVLQLLTALKQITNHPAQYLGQTGPLTGRSGKVDAFDELVDAIVAAGDGALVFTQYVVMGRLLEAHLASRAIPTRFLHGRVRASRRSEMVEEFQAGAVPVFLLSLKAGGVGLNLTRATHVIHYDRWWNPAVEDQATDRAYRIGQERPVQVHRLISEGTVEDRISALLATKRDLADAVVGAGEGWIGELSDGELAALVTLGPQEREA